MHKINEVSVEELKPLLVCSVQKSWENMSFAFCWTMLMSHLNVNSFCIWFTENQLSYYPYWLLFWLDILPTRSTSKKLFLIFFIHLPESFYHVYTVAFFCLIRTLVVTCRGWDYCSLHQHIVGLGLKVVRQISLSRKPSGSIYLWTNTRL